MSWASADKAPRCSGIGARQSARWARANVTRHGSWVGRVTKTRPSRANVTSTEPARNDVTSARIGPPSAAGTLTTLDPALAVCLEFPGAIVIPAQPSPITATAATTSATATRSRVRSLYG